MQRTAGNAAVVQYLLNRTPAYVFAQRKAMLTSTGGTPPHEMTSAERRNFVRHHFPEKDRHLAAEILSDIAAAGDSFIYTGEAELKSELVKRVAMSRLMRASQLPVHGVRAFGYPFSGESLYWGPRVN